MDLFGGAFGYVDPGTGSLFIQAVIGAVLAGGIIFRSAIKKIYDKVSAVFSRGKQKSDEDV